MHCGFWSPISCVPFGEGVRLGSPPQSKRNPCALYPPCNPPPLQSPPGGERSLGPKSVEILGAEGAKDNFCKAAKAPKLIYIVILWYSFVVQFSPPGGNRYFVTPPPPSWGGNRHDIGGDITRGGRCSHMVDLVHLGQELTPLSCFGSPPVTQATGMWPCLHSNAVGTLHNWEKPEKDTMATSLTTYG